MYKAPYENLIVYKQICLLRILIYKHTAPFAKSEPRRASQMRDAIRSAKQNFKEGYQRGSIRIFINSCKVSYGSMEELIGDIEDCHDDGLFDTNTFNQLMDLAKKTHYLLNNYIQSLFKIEKEGTWKVIHPQKYK
ncbi:MAG: four helix bundle protein [Candidatus Parcubacteria bacterium]|nr:four helix bundle protein [Candidatus Parcubacteria bacterium]